MARKKILMVDDEEAFSRIVKMNLEKTGKYEVRIENRGGAGYKAAKEFRPDLIFLDIVMPDVEGSEVALKIRSDKELEKIPIVFLTATVTMDEVGPSGKVIGGLKYLAKPVTAQQIMDCIEKETP